MEGAKYGEMLENRGHSDLRTSQLQEIAARIAKLQVIAAKVELGHVIGR